MEILDICDELGNPTGKTEKEKLHINKESYIVQLMFGS